MMTWKPWPKRASLSNAYRAVATRATTVRIGVSAYVKEFFARKFNGAAVLVTIGAAIVSLSVAAIYRPAGGILWGLFIILAAIDMRR